MRKKRIGITVRLTPEEYKKVKRKAQQCGLSISSYLRFVGLKEVGR